MSQLMELIKEKPAKNYALSMEASDEILIRAAILTTRHAADLKIAVCLTVVDKGGHIVLQWRMRDASFITCEISFRKAKTACIFKCPSHSLRDAIKRLPMLQQTIDQVPGDAILIEGGLPLEVNNYYIGGIGIAGGNAQEDLEIATYFVKQYQSAFAD